MNRRRRIGTALAWVTRAAVAAFVLMGGFFASDRLAEKLIGPPEQSPSIHEYSWRVAAIVPTSDDGYWREMRLGLQDMAMRRHIGLEFLGPRSPNLTLIVDRLDRAVAARVDGIICHAENVPAVAEAIRRANKAGIPVVTVGVDVPDSGRKAYVGPDSYQLGFEAGRALQTEAQTARIAVLLGGTSPDAGAAGNSFLEGLRSSISSSTGLDIVNVIYTGSDTSSPLSLDWDAIEAVCCDNPGDTLRAAGILRTLAGRRVILIGAGLLPEILQLLRQGTLQATVASYPYIMGSDAVELLADLLGGRPHPSGITSGTQVFRRDEASWILQDLFAGKEDEGDG